MLSVAILFSIICPVIRLLTQGFDEGTLQIARLATASKFPIPISGLVYILVALLLSRGNS